MHSCPTNTGTGMRASVHVKLPTAAKNPKFEEWCDKLRVQVWMVYVYGDIVCGRCIWMVYVDGVCVWCIWIVYVDGVYGWYICMLYVNTVYCILFAFGSTSTQCSLYY